MMLENSTPTSTVDCIVPEIVKMSQRTVSFLVYDLWFFHIVVVVLVMGAYQHCSNEGLL
jgi:hypothetical protein